MVLFFKSWVMNYMKRKLKNGWKLTIMTLRYAHLNDDEIITDITEKPTQEDSKQSEDTDVIVRTVSHGSAIIMFNGCI